MMEVIQKSSVKIPNSVIISRITGTEADEEINDLSSMDLFIG